MLVINGVQNFHAKPHTAQKMFSITDFFSKCADLVTFTKEFRNGKLHLLCSDICGYLINTENYSF